MITLVQPDAFQRVRRFLRERYSEEIVAAALGVASVREFDQRKERQPIRDPLVRLFFAGAAVPFHEIRPSLPTDVAADMSDMGLIRASGGIVSAPIVLYPFFDLHLISDSFLNADGTKTDRDREFVYFALTANTLNYVDSLPDDSTGSFLDVGGGCGAAALLQAPLVSECWSSDISGRCTLYAEFNRRLNDIPNVNAVEGSLYDPVKNRRFDRIGCHPPYDMTAVTPWEFADGGDDGEFVIRGTISGLGEHLAPGGDFVALFRAADRRGRPLEVRVREWLGEAEAEFDIALVVRDVIFPEEHAFSCVMSLSGGFDLFKTCMERYRQMEVEKLVYCSLLIRRRDSSAPPLTLRRTMGRHAGFAEMRWLLDWERSAPATDILPSTFRVSPEIELVVKHRTRNGHLQPVDYSVVTSAPFRDEADCPQWLALLISEFDGHRTAAEIYESMRSTTPLQPQHFTMAVKRLISLGVLQPGSGGLSGKLR